jgi:hypothetical protein
VTALVTEERLAKRCAYFADKDCRGYSPLYERLARQLAVDTALLQRLARLPDATHMPVNLLAAVHYLVRKEPADELARIYRGAPGDPWPPFRAFLDTRFDEVSAVLATHTIQTNEVGRCAALVPAIGEVAGRFADRPLAMIEVGPSAGLNLFFDHYSVLYDDGRRFGAETAPVQLACRLVGPTPPPLPHRSAMTIQSREGIDLAPVDVRDRDACEWLKACIWPDVPGRLERFEAAVAYARVAPPLLHRGDALDLLDDVVAAVPDSCVPLVFTTWALAYFDKPGRSRLHELLVEQGRQRDLALLTAEFPPVTPWLPDAPRAPTLEGTGATLLSVTSWRDGREYRQPLAWTHPHGQWLDWFEPSEVPT